MAHPPYLRPHAFPTSPAQPAPSNPPAQPAPTGLLRRRRPFHQLRRASRTGAVPPRSRPAPQLRVPRCGARVSRGAEIDPDFAMAFWGEAMTKNHPVWMEQDLGAARRILERLGSSPAARIASGKTERERAYLRAVETLYGAGDKRARDIAYVEAMRRAACRGGGRSGDAGGVRAAVRRQAGRRTARRRAARAGKKGGSEDRPTQSALERAPNRAASITGLARAQR